MNIDLNNIADMCKKCIRKQIKTKIPTTLLTQTGPCYYSQISKLLFK